MRFLLHGATNWNATNFGDFLYAYEIFEYLKNNGDNEVGFYDASEYFIKYISLNFCLVPLGISSKLLLSFIVKIFLPLTKLYHQLFPAFLSR